MATQYFDLVCGTCGQAFTSKKNRVRHEFSCKTLMYESEPFDHLCGNCGKSYARTDSRIRHEKECGLAYTGSCAICDHPFTNLRQRLMHEEACKTKPAKRPRKTEPSPFELLAMKPDLENVNEYETAFEGRLKSFFIRSDENLDMTLFLASIKNKVKSRIVKSILDNGAIKINMAVDCLMNNQLGEECSQTFKTKNTSVFRDTNLDEIILKHFEKIELELEESQLKKSGWTLDTVRGLRLKINKYKPLSGSTYIDLPTIIKNKKACINVINDDNQCFRYAILSKLVSMHPERKSSYSGIEHWYDFSSISFPTHLEEIKKFEECNNISVNVFGLDSNNDVYPLKVVDRELRDHRDLLLISKDEKSHYVYIKNFEALVQSQLTKHKHKLTICKRCFTYFDRRCNGPQKMEEHLKLCIEHKPTKIVLPKDEPYVTFKDSHKSLRVPIVVYCDFESILSEVKDNVISSKFTHAFQKHELMSFCAYVMKTDAIPRNTSLPNEPVLYRGKDAATKFLDLIKSIADEVTRLYKLHTPMKTLTDDEKKTHATANVCYMCDRAFTKNDHKVRDHDHISGKYRGPAHNSCNLNCKNPNFIPVIFHNLSGYDAHFIIKNLGYDDKTICVIPNSEEKYISFSKYINKNMSIRFIDSFRFISSSLDELAKTLPSFPIISRVFSPSKLALISRKGVFPYDYVKNWEVLDETKLPTKDKFFSKLTESDITDNDYSHAQKVWTEFKIKNLGEYSDLYLKTDVLLLAEIFETFRTVTLQTHKLDPCHYYTLPGLSWDAMLRLTQVKLELLTDYDKLMIIEKGIRGGICQVSHRHIKANNKYMEEYNPTDESKFITYQDCNNLYGFAMSQSLPMGEFEWVDPSKVDLDSVGNESATGYILDIDIDYPKELHDDHDDLPFLPENIKCGKYRKLVPHLGSRKNYVVHHAALNQALNHGLKLLRINRVLRFKQAPWLKPYIEHNTNLRTLASNNFEKDLYKLYNNAIYGKTMENLRNRLNMKIVAGKKKIEKIIKKPEFIDRTIYNENLAAVHLAKKQVLFNKPIYVGMSILDISKTVMYNYHYDIMKIQYGPKLKLAYMDTDSFIYRITTDDIFEDMKCMLHHLDTSDYPRDHPLQSNLNKKVPGKFKDETNSKIILEFIGLRSKMYSIRLKDKLIKKAKGVSKTALNKKISFDDYYQCLTNHTEFRTYMNTIRSYKHNLFTISVNKLSLSPHDDKRVILEDGISTHAIGFK